MIRLTHVDKIYWPEEKITKGEMLKYYAAVAPYMLRYLKDRPLVLRRYPDGIEGENFFHKQITPNPPPFMKTTNVKHKERKITYYVVNNANSLLYVANLGAIELHPFNSRINNLNNPDYIVIDLDPEGVDFNRVIEVAQETHRLLDSLRIPNLCKTTGGRGIHIYIPMQGKYNYSIAKQWGQLLALWLHSQMPDITSLERNPKNRQKKVYLDYLQNELGQTLVCPYSVRGRAHAPVSTPLSWNEVKRGLDPLQFTLKTVPKRLKAKGDLFKEILGKGIDLRKSLNAINAQLE
jgi:bifunctional non-homologous end joining protein LigD